MAEWFLNHARPHQGFAEIDDVDLAELGLPFLDEPNHPRLRQYMPPPRRWLEPTG